MPQRRGEERPQTNQMGQGLPQPLATVTQVVDVPTFPPEKLISDIVHIIIGGPCKRISQAYLKAKARRIHTDPVTND